ncbi:MAG: hypothetical protein H7A40_03805 [Chlamydiales bacterium]|nr:hypothetical protein [Chlamydiales bacterium]
MKMRKLLPIVAVSALSAGICPSLEEHKPTPKHYQQDSTSNNQKQSSTGAIFERDPMLECYDRNKENCYCECVDPCHEVMVSAGPRVREGANAYISGSFLYWTLRQEGLEFVITGIQNGANPPPTSKGKINHPDFKTEPGFKIGLGWQLPHDSWDMFLQYTWLKGKGENDISGTNMQTIWFQPVIGNVTFAEVFWNHMFNNFDLELGRNFYTSRYLTMRPFAGLKGGWQNEDYKLRYLNELSPSSSAFDRLHMDSFTWYLGMRAGFNTNWYFTKRWSIYGDMALSALWAYNATQRTDRQYLAANPNMIQTTLDSKNIIHTVLPVLELGIGIEWDTFFSCDDYHLAFAIGWEEQVWWGNNFYLSETCPQDTNGNLVMQGLNFTIRFDF